MTRFRLSPRVFVLALAPGLTGVTTTPGGSPEADADGLQVCGPELIEEMRIGALGGRDEYAFSDINSIAVSRSGEIHVDDSHPPSLRKFGPDGRFVRWIGREGEGPGEFGSIAGVSALPDGRLALWDRNARRITVYRSDGEHDEDIRIEGVNPPYPYADRSFRADVEGNYHLRILAGPMSFGPDMAGLRYGYARISPDGTVLDTLAVPEASAGGGRSIVIHTRAGDRGPFPERTLDALSPFGHLVTGFNGTYAFSILDPAGAIEVEPEGFRPVEVKAGERAEWRARVAHAERRSGEAHAEVPRWKPAYRDLWVDSDGRIWVHRYAEAFQRDEPIPELWPEVLDGTEPPITWEEPMLYDVFGADGRLLGCVRVPPDSEVMASRGSLAWGISRGELDEEYVVRWRVPARIEAQAR